VIAGIKGGTFQATATYRNGDDLGKHAGLGVLQQVQEIYGRGQTFRLTQFWYEQKLAGGAVAIKAGRATVGEDFSSFSCYFMNLTFCGSQPGNLVGDYWYNWPVSQWMARLKVSHGDFYGQVAAYQVNPRNLDKSSSSAISRAGPECSFRSSSAGPPQFGSKGLVGSYKVGGWYTNANADDVFLDINRDPATVTGLAPLQRSSRYGFWINAWQQLIGYRRQRQAALRRRRVRQLHPSRPEDVGDRQPDRARRLLEAALQVAAGRRARLRRRPDQREQPLHAWGQELDPAHPEPQTRNMRPNSITARTRPTGSRCGRTSNISTIRAAAATRTISACWG
jgi:hypothetical protein